MSIATEKMLKTHESVRMSLEALDCDGAQFLDAVDTLRGTLSAHAHLQDDLFLPALHTETSIEVPFLRGIVQEHLDLDLLLRSLYDTSLDRKRIRDAKLLQIRSVIATHLDKEESVLYPLADAGIDSGKLSRIGAQMSLT